MKKVLWIGLMLLASAFFAFGAALAQAPVAGSDTQADAALVQRVCVGCHDMNIVTAQGRSPADWSEVIDRMVDHGAQASVAELAEIKAYLAKTAPLQPRQASAR